MDVRRFWIIGAECALAAVALIPAIAGEGDQLIAKVGKPAIVTATPAEAPQGIAPDKSARRVVVHVTGYQPPRQGGVRGVVKVQKTDGTEQQIGTFGVFPDAAFNADTSRARTYSFALPKELATDAVSLKIEIVPDKAQGTGEGAQLEIGRAEIQ
jgi:hypothetical protein